MATIDETAERFQVQSVTGDRLWLVRRGKGKREWFESPDNAAVSLVEQTEPGVFVVTLPHVTLTYRRLGLPPQ
jgi:hypothetical protein